VANPIVEVIFTFYAMNTNTRNPPK